MCNTIQYNTIPFTICKVFILDWNIIRSQLEFMKAWLNNKVVYFIWEIFSKNLVLPCRVVRAFLGVLLPFCRRLFLLLLALPEDVQTVFQRLHELVEFHVGHGLTKNKCKERMKTGFLFLILLLLFKCEIECSFFNILFRQWWKNNKAFYNKKSRSKLQSLSEVEFLGHWLLRSQPSYSLNFVKGP